MTATAHGGRVSQAVLHRCYSSTGMSTGSGIVGSRLPDPTRRGNAPAFVHRTGTPFAPLWATECFDCGEVLPWRPRLSRALADLGWHQEMHRVWRSEVAS